ncbi:MAG TPA: TetR/AcrR family transcriptional regulator [bacterium]
MRTEASIESNAPRPESARDKILGAAMELFYRQDIHTVGVDAIIAKAGVAKMSFYRHFPAKDDLVRAFLEEQDRRYWQWWDGVMAEHAGDPRRQLLALFEAISVRLLRPSYRGCAFINFTAEFAQAEHPGYPVVTANKREQRARLLGLSSQLGARQPELLADQLMLLIEGARVSMLTLGAEGPASTLGQSAAALMDAALVR